MVGKERRQESQGFIENPNWHHVWDMGRIKERQCWKAQWHQTAQDLEGQLNTSGHYLQMMGNQ